MKIILMNVKNHFIFLQQNKIKHLYLSKLCTMKNIYLLLSIIFSLFTVYKTQAQSDNYVIATTISDTTDPWYEPVRVLRDYRNAEVVTFEVQLIDFLIPAMINTEARYVAVIVRPEELDINLVRKFLVMSTMIDSDPFTDFAYGYITGATPQDAVNFINKIIQAEAQHVENYPLHVSGFAASSINYIYTTANTYMKYLNPASYNSMYMETNDNGSGNTYFHSNTSILPGKKILDIGHNGDPHMIWLFEGGNSSTNPPIWDYDSTKIENPAYARVGISSYDIAGLNLYPAVVYNGACHSGVPKRAIIEGDIAATFGDTDWEVKFYNMSDSFSFALTLLKTGITGYFAPCGANNANDQSEEVYASFLYNEPLGDIHKRSMDGVVMGFLGNRPALKLFQEGASTLGCDVLTSGTFNPTNWSGACYMLGGKANRIYFGCPLYNPFANNHDNQLEITTAQIDSIDLNTLHVNVNFNKPDVSEAYFPVWDKFHHGNTRIYIPVEMPQWVSEISSVSVLSSTSPYDLAFHAIEKFDEKLILHLEAAIPNDMYEAIDFDITFLVNYLNNSSINDDYQNTFLVYPNPTSDQLHIKLNKPSDIQGIRIIDMMGRVILTLNNPLTSDMHIDVAHLNKGLYILEIQTTDSTIQRCTFAIEK